MFAHDSIEGFLERLASSSPTPGGGAASALAAAMGCATAEMVAAITAARGGERACAMQELGAELAEARSRFLTLAEEDAQGYARVAAALKLPRATEREAEGRARVLEASLMGATEAPFAVAELAIRCLEKLQVLASEGVAAAASDVLVAAGLLRGSVDGAAATVLANTAWMRRKDLAAQLGDRVDALRCQGDTLAAQAQAQAEKALR